MTGQPPAAGVVTGRKRRALVLLNFGGPRDLSEVPGFLYEILRDPNTIQLPLPQWAQDWLARRIARRRSHEVARQYGEIGGHSPIVAATDQIGNALRNALGRASEGKDPLPVYIAHRYLPGHTRATVASIMAADIDALLAIPLYPHFSFATNGSSFQQLHALLEEAGWRGELMAVRSYPDTSGYVDALADRLHTCLEGGDASPGNTVILCSAHGLPRSYVDNGDPYRLELYRTLEALRIRFPDWRFELSFQSRVGPAEWLRPYTDEIIPALAGQGITHLVFVPLSFVNDHIETLYEVGVTYFNLARSHGLVPHRAQAVEDHTGFIGVLAQAAETWLAGRGGVPLVELLPPDQSFNRTGRWAWGLWLAALFATLLFALCS